MTETNAPLVAFKDLGLCDSGGHEITLLTDGNLAHAVCAGVEATAITRELTIIEVGCTAKRWRGETCDGSVKFDLSAGGNALHWGPGWAPLDFADWETLRHTDHRLAQ